MPRKILIIEDAETVVEGYKAYLASSPVEILTAATLLSALEILKANPDVELIAVDGCFPRDVGESDVPEPGRACSGEKFIVNARFKGPIIACSSDDFFNRKMRAIGATHVASKGRPVLRLICELLGIPHVTKAD